MKIYRTGDPCPCCGQPIHYTDPETLRLFNLVVFLAGLRDPEGEGPVPNCGTCKYYVISQGVCCNVGSERVADLMGPEDSCPAWEPKKKT